MGMKPATQLPFTFVGNEPYDDGAPYCRIAGGGGFHPNGFEIAAIIPEQDARYIVHACNAYPQLEAENSRLRGALYLIAAGDPDAQETAKAALKGQS